MFELAQTTATNEVKLGEEACDTSTTPDYWMVLNDKCILKNVIYKNEKP